MIDPALHARAVALAEESMRLAQVSAQQAERAATVAEAVIADRKRAQAAAYRAGLRHAALLTRDHDCGDDCDSCLGALAAKLERAAEEYEG